MLALFDEAAISGDLGAFDRIEMLSPKQILIERKKLILGDLCRFSRRG